jgi:ArsR family transcriptional regulator
MRTGICDGGRMDVPLPPSCIDMNLAAEPPEPLTDERIAALAKALGNPKRLEIVRYLSQCRPHIANEIVEAIGLAQSTISEHIRELREVGIVIEVDDPPRVWYCVNRRVLAQLSVGVAQLPRPFDEAELMGVRTRS